MIIAYSIYVIQIKCHLRAECDNRRMFYGLLFIKIGVTCLLFLLHGIYAYKFIMTHYIHITILATQNEQILKFQFNIPRNFYFLFLCFVLL